MALFQWQKTLEIGFGEVDQQHQRLFGLLNELHDAMGERRGKEALGKTIQELVRYTQEHFACEEGHMRRANYPQQAAHKALHDALVAKAQDFQRRYAADEFVFPGELLTLLSNWLVQHIQSEDVRFAAYVRQRAAA